MAPPFRSPFQGQLRTLFCAYHAQFLCHANGSRSSWQHNPLLNGHSSEMHQYYNLYRKHVYCMRLVYMPIQCNLKFTIYMYSKDFKGPKAWFWSKFCISWQGLILGVGLYYIPLNKTCQNLSMLGKWDQVAGPGRWRSAISSLPAETATGLKTLKLSSFVLDLQFITHSQSLTLASPSHHAAKHDTCFWVHHVYWAFAWGMSASLRGFQEASKEKQNE